MQAIIVAERVQGIDIISGTGNYGANKIGQGSILRTTRKYQSSLLRIHLPGGNINSHYEEFNCLEGNNDSNYAEFNYSKTWL
jgi:hypothetical protein